MRWTLVLPLLSTALACGTEPLADREHPGYTVACVEEPCGHPDGGETTCTWRCVQWEDRDGHHVQADTWRQDDRCGNDEPGLPVDGICARLYGGP